MYLEFTFGRDWIETLDIHLSAILQGAVLMTAFSMLWFLRKPKLRLPPGPVSLPFVGYLPFLGKEPFKTLDSLSKKYGNVFSLYLGPKYVVILGDYHAVKEAFNKEATLNRPPGSFDFQPDGFGITSSNGEDWVQLKRFLLRTMRDLGLGRNAWEQLLEEEVSDFLNMIAKNKGEPMDIGKPLTSSVSNNMASLVFGKRLPPGPRRDMLNSSIQAIMLFFTNSGLWYYFPWLCNFFVKLKIGNSYKYFSEMAGLNTFVRNETEIHRKSQDYRKGNDLVSRFIQAMESNQEETKKIIFNERNLIGSSQSLFSAGSDTIRASLMWLFLAMTAYPDVQRKLHLELDSFLGRERKILWEDRFKLPYTYALIMEGQRWKTLVPLNLTRITSEDIKLCDYDIPKESTILANLWALHNDPRYWEDPEKFIPERFLQNDGKEINLKTESYAPFSYGRRKCPGDTVALMEIFIYFASIMQKYEIRVPNGGKPNFNAVIGLTYMPVDQDLCFILR